MSYYSFIHQSVKWWCKVFFWVLEMSTVNSYIIYQHTCQEQKQKSCHLAFRRALVKSLVEPLLQSQCPPPLPTPLSDNRLKHKNSHYMEKTDKRRDCIVCSKRGESRHLTMYICKTCEHKPPICPDKCFEMYHSRKRYREE